MYCSGSTVAGWVVRLRDTKAPRLIFRSCLSLPLQGVSSRNQRPASSRSKGFYFLGPCKTTVIRILEIDGSKSTRPLCSFLEILLLRDQLCTLVLDRSVELVSGTLLSPYKAQLTLVREALIVFITSQLFLLDLPSRQSWADPHNP